MARKKQSSRKSSNLAPAPSAIHYMGQVNPDFAAFVWGFSPKEVRSAANTIAKHLEMQYQLILFQQSGFQIEE